MGQLVLAARSFADMLDVPPDGAAPPSPDHLPDDSRDDPVESEVVSEEFDRWVNMMLYAADRLAEMARHDPELIAAAAASTASAEDQLWKGILRLASIRSSHGPGGPPRHLNLIH